MKALFLMHLRYLLRSRFLVLLCVLSFGIQFLGMKLFSSVLIKFQGGFEIMSSTNAVFGALVFQIFLCGFLSAAYGIWALPFLHRGKFNLLIFTLPIKKWKFAVSHGLVLLGLFGLMHLLLLSTFVMHFGWAVLGASEFPWKGLIAGVLFLTVAFECLAFLFACLSLAFGPVLTFFSGFFCIFIFNVFAIVYHLNLDKFLEKDSRLFRIVYENLPPIGELIYSLRGQFSKPFEDWRGFVLWGVWLVILGGIYVIQLSVPRLSQAKEG